MPDFQAEQVHGNALMADYTPGSALSAGDVVVQGNVPMIAHLDIAADTKGALAVRGAVYRCEPDAAITAGKSVWWDDTANKVTETASGNAHFGQTVAASYDSDGFVDVVHAPQGVTGAIA